MLGHVCRTPFCIYMGLTERGCMHMHSFWFSEWIFFLIWNPMSYTVVWGCGLIATGQFAYFSCIMGKLVTVVINTSKKHSNLKRWALNVSSADCPCWVSAFKVVTSAVITWPVCPVCVFGCTHHDGLQKELHIKRTDLPSPKIQTWTYMFQFEYT